METEEEEEQEEEKKEEKEANHLCSYQNFPS